MTVITPVSEQKTAVYAPLTDENEEEKTRAFPVADEDTKELPLIAERFAGRYWDGRVEDETDNKPARRSERRWALAFGLAAAAVMLLLVGALTGQAKLTAMNDELVAVNTHIAELQAEERVLCVEAEEAESLSAVEKAAAETLGMQSPRFDQIASGAELSDHATVLNVRRGQTLRHFWERLLDTFVECF